MCYYNGRFVSKIDFIRLKEMEKALDAVALLNVPLQSGFDYAEWPVVKSNNTKDGFEIVLMEWGFLPPTWSTRLDVEKKRKGFKDKFGKWQPPIITLNAMGEELLMPFKMYRDAALHRRCLILSTGFYEWRHIHRLNKRNGQPLKTADKYPYHIKVRNSDYFFMAGIWQPWHDVETGEVVETFSLITTEANKLMEQVHNSKKRMPVILSDDEAVDWLFGNLSERRITELATYQFPAEKMQAYAVRKNFQQAVDPTEAFNYQGIAPLVL